MFKYFPHTEADLKAMFEKVGISDLDELYAELPEEVFVRRAAARRLTKSHRIRTDTGIDITFPSEYSTSPDYLAFRREEDGTMSILIRNVGSIENRS